MSFRAVATPNQATLPWMRHAPHCTQSKRRNTARERCRTCQTPVSSSHSSSSSLVNTEHSDAWAAAARSNGATRLMFSPSMKEWSSNKPWTSSRVDASIFASSSKRVFCIACFDSLTPANTIAKAKRRFDSRSGSQAIRLLYSAAHSSSSSARGWVAAMAWSAGGRGDASDTGPRTRVVVDDVARDRRMQPTDSSVEDVVPAVRVVFFLDRFLAEG
mmetsp:Transcript_21762/g.56858  ORF Transcript_21762/g.56858 Transcript_21762/m.56858 type:complete len:216 (-) Transcript_21762:623-1270(-)